MPLRPRLLTAAQPKKDGASRRSSQRCEVGPVAAHLETTTTGRKRSSPSPHAEEERAGERRVVGPTRIPLSPTLSPFVPHGEREKIGVSA
jgi:hypothetical protein